MRDVERATQKESKGPPKSHRGPPKGQRHAPPKVVHFMPQCPNAPMPQCRSLSVDCHGNSATLCSATVLCDALLRRPSVTDLPNKVEAAACISTGTCRLSPRGILKSLKGKVTWRCLRIGERCDVRIDRPMNGLPDCLLSAYLPYAISSSASACYPASRPTRPPLLHSPPDCPAVLLCVCNM